MIKTKTPMLQPIEVGEIYPVTDNSGRVQRLKGCKFTVVYGGVASINDRRLLHNGLYSGGRGSTGTVREIQAEKGKIHKTKVEYFFREGALFPEPFARANALRDALEKAITDFVPLDVSGLSVVCKSELHDILLGVDYKLTVEYPLKAENNLLFKQFVSQGKPRVSRIYKNEEVVSVDYLFSTKMGATLAYNKAMAFKGCMLSQMNKKQNEDTK